MSVHTGELSLRKSTRRRPCLTLAELEGCVPPRVLLQFVSCIFIQKPTIRDLVRLYGKVKWVTRQPSIGGGKYTAVKPEGCTSDLRSGETTNADGVLLANFSETTQIYSTIELLRSLSVALQSLPAKKAALHWAEQQLFDETNTEHSPYKLLISWKLAYQKMELRANVVKRRQGGPRSRKLRRKVLRHQQRERKQQAFREGQRMESEMIEMMRLRINHEDTENVLSTVREVPFVANQRETRTFLTS